MREPIEAAWDANAIRGLFDASTGWLDRRVHSDEALYRLELERIFARSWNFVCHESQIPNSGDYFINYIGEDQVICVRDKTGQINVLLNTCRHRGNALCRAEKGRAKSFVCSYHGWNYGLDGTLIGVPGQSTYYHGALDKSRLGLAKARVESYLGFYFATFAEDAPSLDDFLGDVGRTGIGMIQAYGDVEVVEGVQKNVIDCNWKIAVDNLFDWYHVAYSHASADTAGFFKIPRILFPNNQLVMLGEYGHAISGPGVTPEQQSEIDSVPDDKKLEMAEAAARTGMRMRPSRATGLMGTAGVRSNGHPNIFPNLWVTMNGLQICLRLPRGPLKTELWWFTLVPKDAKPEFRQALVWNASHVFGPAGLLEQDDGENWSQSTRASVGYASKKLGHVIAMGLGKDRVAVDGNGQRYIDTRINEHGQRWLYGAWTEWMTADSWAELKANHSAAPTGVV